VIYRFIEAEKATFKISFLCVRLGVPRSGFYDCADARSIRQREHVRTRC
jgi:putative transposase